MTKDAEPQKVTTDNNLSHSEQLDRQIDATINFSRYLVTRYPQVDDMRQITVELTDKVSVQLPKLPDSISIEPQLNYYLAGSLATTLLSRADRVDLCRETTGSDIQVDRTVAVPEATKALLTEFARPIGDIDYVTTTHYEDLQQQVQDSYKRATNEEYQQGRAKYLWKGGGGPTFGEVPADALGALKRREDQTDSNGIMCDPLSVFGTRKFARVMVEGQGYYIARPDTIVGYKILHMLQSFDQYPDKFNADFTKIHQALVGLYPEDELVAFSHSTLAEYEKSMAKVWASFNRTYEPKLPKLVGDLLGNENLGQEARAFIGKVIDYDQDHGQILSNRP